MALKKKVLDSLNEQMNFEIYSAYIYQAMAAEMEENNLKGFANWLSVQAKEEMEHAMRFYRYIVERGNKPVFDKIPKPKGTYKSELEVFEDALEHEKIVTGRIHKILFLARQEKDYATESMLKWFVDEQVEEEDQTDEIVQKLKMIKNAPGGLFMLDKELGSRKD